MSAIKISASLFLFCLLLCLFSRQVNSQSQRQSYLAEYCPNLATYSANSTYEANLNQFLRNLSSNSANHGNGFNSLSVGRDPSDTVYGLFLCRGDVNMNDCQQCVRQATAEIIQRCPNKREAIIWYDQCMLRYSNKSTLSRQELSVTVIMYNTGNVTDDQIDRFNQVLADTINKISTEAANSQSGKKFATREVNFTAYQTIYTLVQCTPDLSSGDCNSYLQSYISTLSSCCNNRIGATLLSPSSNIRYEMYPFYASTSPPPPPPTTPLLPPSPGNSTTNQGNGGTSTKVIIAIIVAIAASLMVFFIGLCFIIRRTRKKSYDTVKQENDEGNGISTVESLQYDLNTIHLATNNFSSDNKIGEGGFGTVYKGILPDGQEIAVKRLAEGSGQGANEFKNEVVLVAKLQHRNLVRLIGFCLEREEKILIYEYVPNKSLDYFLFDPEKGRLLDWSKRYKIIGGIARGMVYLHEDSRLRIIHRDLKASNILLDGDMNSKISDFGMAKICGVDESQGNTNRVVGTFGYMAPEYVTHGQFSVKSDVFSFGILVLEIISGRKSSSFYHSTQDESLISYAWKLWREGSPLDLVDPTLQDSYVGSEVIRCIQIGLLCVEENVEERPNMASVLLTLNSQTVTLGVPRQPAFFLGSRTWTVSKAPNSDQSTSASAPLSVNEASISELYPR